MFRNIGRVLLAILPLMVLFGAANADKSSVDSRLIRTSKCFEESIPMLDAIRQEFATSYMDCFLNEETKNSKDVIVAPIEDDGGLYEDYIVDPVEKCQNASKRAYVENTAKNYKVLSTCLRSESLVSTTTESTTVENEVPSTGSTLLSSTTSTTELTATTTSLQTTTSTQKPVDPPKGGGSNSFSKTNVSYILLGINILKYVFHA